MIHPRMAYACLPEPSFRDGDLSLVAVQPEHIEDIRLCRNAQMDVLRQSAPIASEEQTAYFAANIWPDMARPRPKNILLSYLERGKFIGYGGLVHMAWEHRRAEVSFLLEPGLAGVDNGYRQYFSTFLGLIQRIAFEDLKLHRLFTETYATRAHHISVLESSGFALEGRMRDHVRIQDEPVDSLLHGCLGSDRSRRASG